MTADPARRRSRARRGAAAAGALVVVALIAVVVGITTLRTSEVGEAVDVDRRTRIEFPSTPTTAIAVVDEEDRLTSLAIATLLPSGSGGSLVTVPVNFDTSSGLGDVRTPLNGRPVVADDEDNIARLVTDLESVLRLTVPFTAVMSEDDLGEWLEPLEPMRLDLPEPVIDSGADDEVQLAGSGRQDVDAETLAELFTAIDINGETYDHHPNDVAMWEAVAAEAGREEVRVEVPLDEFDRPVEPADADEVLTRLLAGPVAVRDLAIDRALATELPNPDEVDVVLLDQFDAILVFAQIAPALVLTPNESLTFQIIAPFTDDQVAELGDGITTEVLVRQLISELVFAEGNVVSVQTSPQPDGADDTTRLDVVDDEFIEPIEEIGPILFGEIEVDTADSVIDGVDVVAVLGTDFLVRRAEILAGDDAEASFAPEEDEGSYDGTEPLEDVSPASADGTDETSGTVADDE